MVTRRLMLVTYFVLLFYGTHCPLKRDTRFDADAWWQVAMSPFADLGQMELPGGLVRGDKLIHFAAFGLLALLVFRVAVTLGPFQQVSTVRRELRFCGGILLGLWVYALIDEGTQPFFGRTFDWIDYAANVLGILSVAVAYAILRLWKRGWTTERVGPASVALNES